MWSFLQFDICAVEWTQVLHKMSKNFLSVVMSTSLYLFCSIFPPLLPQTHAFSVHLLSFQKGWVIVSFIHRPALAVSLLTLLPSLRYGRSKNEVQFTPHQQSKTSHENRVGAGQREMVSLGFLVVGLLLQIVPVSRAYGYYGGWTNAHATFYGGSDASGTMGKHFVDQVN